MNWKTTDTWEQWSLKMLELLLGLKMLCDIAAVANGGKVRAHGETVEFCIHIERIIFLISGHGE